MINFCAIKLEIENWKRYRKNTANTLTKLDSIYINNENMNA